MVEFLTGVIGPEAGGGGADPWRIGRKPDRPAGRAPGQGRARRLDPGQPRAAALLVSEQAHYCIARSVQIMGWGSEGAWPVATDARFRMDLADLPRAHAAAEAAGRRVIAVVGSACSTATGSFDPLEGIADYCERHGLWMHVDGAHGASLALSPRTRDRLAGAERADSLVWDLHKMMGLPALSTAVLFREERRAYEAFAQEAGYLFDATPPQEQWFNLGHRTLECTKRGMGVTAAFLFHLCGTAWFGEQVELMVERTAWLTELIETADDFELACPPEANIVCFRHLGVDDLDAHQARIREAVVASGSHYLVQAKLRGELWLRCTLMNTATTREDLESLLDALRAAAIPEPSA